MACWPAPWLLLLLLLGCCRDKFDQTASNFRSLFSPGSSGRGGGGGGSSSQR
jgi:hypothetical protein